ncbi:MAG: hypothetical protein A2583_09735 [Bdellovibrionales bacterium RIFOXYD1_FULL_53_11]|nr:MAG: hypothetical protein A2583_09735 [Bdellovibrionales bacterium RIFOXYD1_FULL_53_11]
MKDDKRPAGKFEKPAIILAAAAVITTVLMGVEFNLLESTLYDIRTKHGPQIRPSSDIVLVTIDSRTTHALSEFSPLPMDAHAAFMEKLESHSPRAVGYIVDMNRVAQSSPAAVTGQWSSRFVSAAKRMSLAGSHILLGTSFDVTGEVLPPFPLSALPHATALIHKDGNVFSGDKVTRRAIAYLYDKPAFHLAMAQGLGLRGERWEPRGTFYVPEADSKYFFFRYHGNPVAQKSIPELSAHPVYERISFIDVLRNRIRPGTLTGKIVLVGTMSKDDSGDFAFTPYSKMQNTNPRIVIHANILDSILRGDSIRRVPGWTNWLATFAAVAFVLWWVLNSTPMYGVFATLGLASAVLVAWQIVFSLKGLWIRESQPLVGIFLGYYLAVPYRLIQEYKKRWDYQRKNEILTQVEELKTNFLSLVTHDLKTPVARIQGLAEVLMREAGKNLDTGGKSTVKSIINATEELNRFISSILELNRIESNRLKPLLESRDVNQVVEKCVEGFRAQASAAGINLKSSLEPMFPIKIDPSLISKVTNNLIDNALKYSSPGSEVLVESRENGEWVEISVKDRGIGMTEEECHNLFTRFYRAKNNTTARVHGTGLGLYLTKFFIEAHKGRVKVQSATGKGSVFTIMLPADATKVHTEKENNHVQSTCS